MACWMASDGGGGACWVACDVGYCGMLDGPAKA